MGYSQLYTPDKNKQVREVSFYLQVKMVSNIHAVSKTVMLTGENLGSPMPDSPNAGILNQRQNYTLRR